MLQAISRRSFWEKQTFVKPNEATFCHIYVRMSQYFLSAGKYKCFMLRNRITSVPMGMTDVVVKKLKFIASLVSDSSMIRAISTRI